MLGFLMGKPLLLKAEAVLFDFSSKIKQQSSWLEENITLSDTFIDLDNTPTM